MCSAYLPEEPHAFVYLTWLNQLVTEAKHRIISAACFLTLYPSVMRLRYQHVAPHRCLAYLAPITRFGNLRISKRCSNSVDVQTQGFKIVI